MKFTVVGSLNTDLVTTLNFVPEAGATVHANGFATHFGGKGLNQAYAMRRLAPEAEVAMVGCVGTDEFGKALFAHLSKSKIDVSDLKQLDSVPTGVATILVECSGDNRIMVFSGANGQVQPPKSVSGDAVVLQNEIPLDTTFKVIEMARSSGVTSVFNPSPLPEVPLSQWPPVDVLVVNGGEAAELSKVENHLETKELATKALPALLQTANLVVITLGGNGVVWQQKGQNPNYIPSCEVEHIVDTTGAGDTFLAALVTQLTTPLEQAMKFAAKAAAITVSRPGASSSIPSLNEVQQSMYTTK